MFVESENHRPEWLFIATLILINLAAKAAFIGINTGEYTDGVLQLTVFSTKAGLYPPLYGALAHGLAALGLSLEMAGRLISVVAAALCVAPVYWLAMRLGGGASARVAGLLYTVSPLPWRWSVRVMTDSLYLFLGTVAMLLLMEAWSRDRRAASRCLAGAVAVAGLSALTRYQGALFAPLLLAGVFVYFRRFRAMPWLALCAGVIWLALPAWMYWNGFAHESQIASRTGPSALATAMAWWNTFESFVLISPYYMGYPVMAAALAGLFCLARNSGRLRDGQRPMIAAAALLWGGYGIMLLVLQAMFGSFQYRYMMPLLPIVVGLAGVGFAALERRVGGRRWIFSVALMASVIYLVVFSLAVLVLQREAFGDQREAAEFIKNRVPPDAKVYANERYGTFTNLGSVKLSFWSGRPVHILSSTNQPMEPGSVLALGTAYGGDAAVGAILNELSAQYQLQPLTRQPFRSQITPLMDDIMTNPMFNQNPLGWVMRYVPQHFATQLFLVEPKGDASPSTRGSASNGA